MNERKLMLAEDEWERLSLLCVMHQEIVRMRPCHPLCSHDMTRDSPETVTLASPCPLSLGGVTLSSPSQSHFSGYTSILARKQGEVNWMKRMF